MGDSDFRPLAQCEPGTQKHMFGIDVRRSFERWHSIVVELGLQQPEMRYEIYFSFISLMAMKPTGTLDEKVDWSDFGDHQIEIQIQALLDNLGGNENRSERPDSAFAIDIPAGLPESN